MKSKKEKILYIILLILIILIIGFIILYVINKKNINVKDNENSIYGKWIFNSSRILVDNEVNSTNSYFKGDYMIINKDDIDICYYVIDKLECYKSIYVIDNNSIIINGITAYLPEKSEYYFENGHLILKERNNDLQYTEMIFERE